MKRNSPTDPNKHPKKQKIDTQNMPLDKHASPPPQTTSGGNNVSNPYSTGGGGYRFEQNVQAFFLAFYLMDAVFPVANRNGCCKIQLQSRRHGYQTDDLTVYFNDNNNQQTCKLLIQVKHKLSFTESDEPTTDTLEQAWLDFRNPKTFNPEQDKIAFVTGPLSQTLLRHVCPIFGWARTSDNEQDFMNRFQQNATEKKKKLDIIRSVIEKQRKIEVSDRDLWQFLKVLDLLPYDCDKSEGKDKAHVLTLIDAKLSDNSKDCKNCKNVWNRMLKTVAEFNFQAGVITRETLPEDLQGLFYRESANTTKEWRLPYFDSENFVGNQHYLQQIAQKLEGKKGMHVVVPIVGLGGVGKTYLALKTVSAVSRNYSYIAWFNAHRRESLQEQFLEFAKEHKIFLESSDTMKVKLERIKAWFSKHPDTLLIFDDAEKLAVLTPFFPNCVHILITSLNAKVWSNAIPIDPMEQEDAAEILKREASIELSDTSQNNEIYDLVETLGGLPLAIAQAGAYIGATAIKVSKYIQCYESAKKSMLQDGTLHEKREEHRPVYITFEISINEVKKNLPSACDMLSYCAYFNSKNIPRYLIVDALSDIDNLSLASNKEVAILKKYSLVKACSMFISVHCVVQDVVREKLAIEGSSATWVLKVLKLLNEMYSYDRNDKEALDVAKLLISHMIRVEELAFQSSDESFKCELGEILYKIGVFYLDYLYDSKKAKEYLKEAEKHLQNHLLIRNINRYLLKACTMNRESSEAEQYASKFSISEEDNVDVLCCLGNYKLRLSRDEARYDDAKTCFKKALKIAESKHKNEKIAMVKHYLGTLYRKWGDKQYNVAISGKQKGWKMRWNNKRMNESQRFYEESLEYYQASLDLKKKIYHKDHPEIARAKHQLGITQLKLKLYRNAKENLKEAFDELVLFYGTDCRQDVLDILHNLGDAYSGLGQLKEARDIFEQCLTKLESLPDENSRNKMKKIKRKLENVKDDPQAGKSTLSDATFEDKRPETPAKSTSTLNSDIQGIQDQLDIWRSLQKVPDVAIQSTQNFDIKPYDVPFEVGNCLFNAILAQTSEFHSVKDVRSEAISRLQSDCELQNILQVASQEEADQLRLSNQTQAAFENHDQYIKLMSQDGTWGTYLEVVALSRSLQRPIVIFSQSFDRPHVVQQDNYSSNSPIFLERNGEHYRPMKATEGANVEDVMSQIRSSERTKIDP